MKSELEAVASSVDLWLRDRGLDSLPTGFSLADLADPDSPHCVPEGDPWGAPYILTPRPRGFDEYVLAIARAGMGELVSAILVGVLLAATVFVIQLVSCSKAAPSERNELTT